LALTTLPAAAETSSATSPGSSVINVFPEDLSTVNVSSGRTFWDSVTPSKFAEFPVAGTRWALDIENKEKGFSAIDASGLTLGVYNPPGSGTLDASKIRYQYYLGTGGFPTIDSQSPNAASLFEQPLNWNQTLRPGGDVNAGVGLQIQLEKLIPGTTDYARVTITNSPIPGTGDRNLGGSSWFANTNIHSDGYLLGSVVAEAFLTTGAPLATILRNFGDFRVVSFGPNLGRDYTYDYSIQDFTILGHTFHFTDEAPEPEGPPIIPPVITPEPPAVVSEPPATSVPGISVVAAPILVFPRPELVVQPPVVNPPTINSPPPAPSTQARVIADLGSTTAELLANYGALNAGASPPAAGDVLAFDDESVIDQNGSFNNATPFTASLTWDANSGDQWVDVWARSSPTYIGTFPVIDGVLQITDADVSMLAEGNHHLVFVGQTSGSNQVVALTMRAADETVTSSAVERTSSSPLDEGSSGTQWARWVLLALLLAGLASAVIITHRRRAKAKQEPSA